MRLLPGGTIAAAGGYDAGCVVGGIEDPGLKETV
jgi:hypothetical protein